MSCLRKYTIHLKLYFKKNYTISKYLFQFKHKMIYVRFILTLENTGTACFLYLETILTCTGLFIFQNIHHDATLIADGTSRHDMKQGDLNDCWFLSTLSAIAEKPQLISKVGRLILYSRDIIKPVPSDQYCPHTSLVCSILQSRAF